MVARLDSLISLLPKLEAMSEILERIGNLDDKIYELALLHETSIKLTSLDDSLKRLQSLESPKTVQVVEKVPVVQHQRQDHEFNRLKALGKFAQLAGKAREIELEWQKIQQEEHDAFFAYNLLHGRDENNHAYRKGVTDGIKWCVDRFC